MLTDIVFVFGSNLAGRHGKGAALDAVKLWGAEYGVGEGLTGNSWALPTKDENLNTLPLSRIKNSVDRLIMAANNNPDRLFYVTAFGTGLAGYKISDILPFFRRAPLPYNLVFTKDWL